MPRIVKTIEEYITNDRQRDTIFMSFNAQYAKAYMNIPLDENEKFLDKKQTNEDKRTEFLEWMRVTYPHVHLEDVFDNVPMGYMQWPFLGSIAIDVEIDSPEYHAINNRYEDENGEPKALDAVVWIMSYDVAKKLHAKKEAFWRQNLNSNDIGIEIRKAQILIQESDAILILAGAGMGVDSGLPDFRGNDGFWKAYPIAKERRLSFEALANPEWFEREPTLAWAFHGHRLNLYRETTPHDGFRMLRELCRSKGDDYFVVTSNVDGQFQKAGFEPDKICEIHGSIHHFQCASSKDHSIWDATHEHVKVDMENFKAQEPFPLCPECGKIARPNIMMFGDWDYLSSRSDSQMKRFGRWKLNMNEEEKKVAVIEIGAGTSIPSIRRMSESVAKQFQTPLIRINPREAQGLHDTIKLLMGGLNGIKEILKYNDHF